jgi:hypothetical protein
MTFLNTLIDKLQAAFPVNRVVALASPLVGAGVAAGAAWVAQHFPGLPVFDSAQLTAIAVTAFSSVVVAAYKWIDGWQKHEEHGSPGLPEPAKRKR